MSKSTATATATPNATTSNPRTSKPRRARAVAPAAAPVEAVDELELDTIDYEPALAAVGDLFSWAFDLAEKNVAHWRQGKRRVKRARRYLRALLRGNEPIMEAAEEDLAFTAGLLVRIFDADLGLGLGAIASIFDELGLPTEDVPPPMPHASGPSISRRALDHIRSIYHALSPVEAEAARLTALRLSSAERALWIERLTAMPVPAAVAAVRAHLYPRAKAVGSPLRRPATVRVMRAAPCAGCSVAPSPFRVAA